MLEAEKATAPHSSTLAWKIPWVEEPGGLQSMGSHRVGHDWATSLSLFTFMRWRRKWQPTPLLLPGKSYGQRSLVGYHPWGHKESDTIEWLHFHFTVQADRSFIKQRTERKSGHSPSWLPFLYSLSPPLLLVLPYAKYKWVYAQSGKGTCRSIREIQFLRIH